MPTLTKAGHARFVHEHAQLVKNRVSALQDMVRMRELGDLSENAGYRAAKGKVRRIDSRIRFIDKLLRTSRVIDPSVLAQEKVHVGARVVMHDDVRSHTYTIVDSVESDIQHGRISLRSPMGKALVGKKVNAIVRVHTPQGVRTITIDSISY